MYQGLIDRYPSFLPVSEKTPIITLQEGNTPLIPATTLSQKTGLEVYLKYEGMNPSGSFKDRGMTLAVSKAKEKGVKVIICASTGNTSASAAAYAARAGLQCVVLIPEGKIAKGKLVQALMHGAKVISLEGNFDQALQLTREITEKYPIELVNSINPFRIEGQKTAAFEVCDQLGEAPDYLAIPVGNAGNITAYWKGFKEYHAAKKIRKLPKMFGFQAEGASPIVIGKRVEHPETVASAIRIGNPASWKNAEAARDESGGNISAVSDSEILSAYEWLAQKEGVFCEPASAASVAGLLKQSASGQIKKGGTVVCVLTGHGLKDPDTAMGQKSDVTLLPPRLDAILSRLNFG